MSADARPETARASVPDGSTGDRRDTGGCWVGVWCGAESWELERWGKYLRGVGASESVVRYLLDSAGVVGGHKSSDVECERLREIEIRAMQSIERKRTDVSVKAAAIVGKVFADSGASVGDVLSAAGLQGWAKGAEAGAANAGIFRSRKGVMLSVGEDGVRVRRENSARSGAGAAGSSGEIGAGRAALSGRVRGTGGRPPVTAADTRRKDAEYGVRFESWAAVTMCAMGFKMRHVARGLGLDTSTVWRYISGYRRHWKREGLSGRVMPPVSPDWEVRLKGCVDLASGTGTTGARVKRSGVVRKDFLREGDVDEATLELARASGVQVSVDGSVGLDKKVIEERVAKKRAARKAKGGGA